MFDWLKTIFGKTQLEKTDVDTRNLPLEKAAEVINEVKEEKSKKTAPKKRGRPKKKTD